MSAVLSRRTYAVFALAVLSIALIAAFVGFEVGGETVALWVSDLGGALVVLVGAIFILGVAFSFGKGEGLRTQWMFVGLGALSFAIGDLVWTYFEAVRGIDPYPSLADVFYLLQYPLLAWGLIRAGVAYRGLLDVRKPFYIAILIGAIGVAALYFGLLKPVIFTWDDTLMVKALSSIYPVADVLVGLVPALFLVLVVAQLGGGRFGWPWMAVVVGVTLIALTDTAYSWLAAVELYESPSVIDYGWLLGYSALAVGASIALDIARPIRRVK